MSKIPEGQMLLDLGEPFDISTAVMPTVEKKEKPKKVFDKPKSMAIAAITKSADSLLKQAETINTEVSGNYTRKRQAQADSNQKKKDRLIAWRRILLRLISEWEHETIPEILEKIRNAKDIEFLVWNGGFPKEPDGEHPIDGWYRKEYPAKLKKAQSLGAINKEIYGEMVCLLGDYMLEEESPLQKSVREYKELMKQVREANIPGFFPTPDGMIDRMIDYAHIENGMSILEPSAGIGSIPERLLYHEFDCDVFCVERMSLLAEVLSHKCFKNERCDIMEWQTERKFDRILMNPPFEKAQDVDHVLHCYMNFLAEKGKLISIMSAGTISNTTKKHVAFREWIEEKGGFFTEPEQSFKDAFNSTGTSTVMLIIDK
jgi:hypothetical protein